MVRAPSRPVACRASLLPQQYCVGLLTPCLLQRRRTASTSSRRTECLSLELSLGPGVLGGVLHARRSVCCCASAAQLLPVHKSADSLATDKSIHMMNSRRFDSYFMAEAKSVDLMQSSQSLSGSPSSRCCHRWCYAQL